MPRIKIDPLHYRCHEGKKNPNYYGVIFWTISSRPNIINLFCEESGFIWKTRKRIKSKELNEFP